MKTPKTVLYFFQVVVLHVGTYNIDDSASDICEAIIKIVEEIQSRLSNVYIIVLVRIFTS